MKKYTVKCYCGLCGKIFTEEMSTNYKQLIILICSECNNNRPKAIANSLKRQIPQLE